MKLHLLSILVVLSNYIQSQSVVFYDTRHAFYAQVENYFSFFSHNNDCRFFSFQTDNGKISQSGCRLSFIPIKPGQTFIKVFKKIKGHLLLFDSIKVVVYEAPTPEAWVGIKQGGPIDKSNLIAIGGLIANIQTRENHSDPIRMKAYTVIVHKQDSLVKYIRNNGARFNDATIELLRELQPGDKVTFTNIEVLLNNVVNSAVRPLEFIIK